MNTYIYPDRKDVPREIHKNYMWKKYYSPLLNQRGNWQQLQYNTPETDIDLVYSPTPKLNRNGKITGSIYHMVNIVSDKVIMNKKLLRLGKNEYLPKMYFFDSSIKDTLKFKQDITNLLNNTSSFFYLKSSSGSISIGLYIINKFSDVLNALNKDYNTTSWLLSEDIPSYLYRRNEKYQLNGIKYNEQIGHKGRLKYFILFKIDSSGKSIYMYDHSVHEIAAKEFKGDYTDIDQNVVIGIGPGLSRIVKYPKGYNINPDFAFDPVTIFGDKYFSVIVPQLAKITHDIFDVSNQELNCKNSPLYNDNFQSCFHLASVDIIIGPDLKCYFLEINTRPAMDNITYESIINYPIMVDGIIQLTVDPYFKPTIKPTKRQEWRKISEVKSTGKLNNFYIAPTWKLSKDMKRLFQLRKNWQEVIYPNNLLPQHSIDFVGKRELKDSSRDTLFKQGLFINKIHTLSGYLGNKRTMYDILSNDPRSFKFLPLTATFDTIQDNYQLIIQHAMNYSESIKTWILKPSMGLQGRDIFISNTYSEVINYIKTKPEYTDWVLSQYLDNPFLLKLTGDPDSGAIFNDSVGRKIHIRLYVLITKIDSKFNIYLYNHNLIFCAVEEYRYSDFKYVFSNLTNLYLGSIFYNDHLGIDGKNAYKDLSFPLRETVNKLRGQMFYDTVVFPQIKTMLELILDNSKGYLKCINSDTSGNRGCFQHIAIDIMPDKDFKLYLLEINSRPGMNAPTYHWGDLNNFTNSLMNKTVDVVNHGKKDIINKKGFILIK
jgi:hypothetical protein